MSRKLSFSQITDSRFTDKEKCLPLLKKRVKDIKQLLDIKNVHIKVSEPYLLKLNDNNIQYKVNFIVEKRTRKTTWNDIYKLVNSVEPVPYKFI